MKNIIILALVFSSSLKVLAQVDSGVQVVEPAATLGSAMKLMSAGLRKITAQVTDPSKNLQSEELALEFIKNTELSKTFVPKSIKQLPLDQQEAQQQRYIKMLDDSIQLGRDLAAAFHNNDNKLANEILAKLSTSKKEGHAEFK